MLHVCNWAAGNEPRMIIILFFLKKILEFSIYQIELAQRIRGIGVCTRTTDMCDRDQSMVGKYERKHTQNRNWIQLQTNVIRQTVATLSLDLVFFSVFSLYFNTCAWNWNCLFYHIKIKRIATIIYYYPFLENNREPSNERPNERANREIRGKAINNRPHSFDIIDRVKMSRFYYLQYKYAVNR